MKRNKNVIPQITHIRSKLIKHIKPDIGDLIRVISRN